MNFKIDGGEVTINVPEGDKQTSYAGGISNHDLMQKQQLGESQKKIGMNQNYSNDESIPQKQQQTTKRDIDQELEYNHANSFNIFAAKSGFLDALKNIFSDFGDGDKQNYLADMLLDFIWEIPDDQYEKNNLINQVKNFYNVKSLLGSEISNQISWGLNKKLKQSDQLQSRFVNIIREVINEGNETLEPTGTIAQILHKIKTLLTGNGPNPTLYFLYIRELANEFKDGYIPENILYSIFKNEVTTPAFRTAADKYNNEDGNHSGIRVLTNNGAKFTHM